MMIKYERKFLRHSKDILQPPMWKMKREVQKKKKKEKEKNNQEAREKTLKSM